MSRTCLPWWHLTVLLCTGALLMGTSSIAWAEDEADAAAAAEVTAGLDSEEEGPAFAALTDVDTLWTCLAAFLVFFMQAGFCLVETGFTRAKNAGNIAMKNLMDFSIGTVGFWLVGFGLMFGLNQTGLFGTSLFMYEADSSFNWAFLIFQTVFCATAATIVSGAMAERTKFASYLIFSAGITMFIYPIFGSWSWNGLMGIDGTAGWLESLATPFHDFAGSTVVHSIGGWAALAGAIVVGPRLGKFVNGKVVPIPGHNLVMGALGVFILWLGWFGFNPGSTTAVGGGDFAKIAVTTNMAAACGAFAGLFASWAMFRKPDISFALNGALAGLVAITAGCDAVTVSSSAIIGLVAGGLVVLSVVFFDKVRVDDPVGAISVHGVCGAWGTLATGLFMTEGGLFYGGGTAQLISQAIGVGAAFLWAFPASLLMFLAIKYTVGIRVSEQEEIEGLDIFEHGVYAYPQGFVTDTILGSPTHVGLPMPGKLPSPAVAGAE